MKRWRTAAAWLSLLCAYDVGCQSDRPHAHPSGSARGSHTIDELHLYAVPVALDLDGKAGTDGFAVRIYASGGDRAKGLSITKGTVEILMFDGVLPGHDARAQPPLRIWSYSADQLPNHAATTSIGIGYRFALRWEAAVPKGERISVAARYIPPKGEPIYSSVSGISSGVNAN